ncbi:FtsK/SpoIIIE domain-containing protein [Arthrobacter sp. NIO-1057]|uniref:FtsK/SpoIIIE domain-containing protein n=1 Tax=Arthrobacter sp. NIO-1057 TaxID=993071 RepID=UPI00071D2462|nr:FtsK/SpoIIIE domain-containing protein [Arthrobacter sp. NIO-1057]KSU64761.1 hypothetical protein AS038_15580 [Arthrobacter sp. NIO-1057]SCC51059.1 DNA segregation ATPase FtsK/SpoIIIE, S-DNA-T family [Arthrobacter sp. NIO-1057]
MARYELLLISQKFQHPRQFEVVSTGKMTGDKLSSILETAFPGLRWYAGHEVLKQVGTVASGQKIVLSDIPQIHPDSAINSSALKLFVLQGPDSGAWISLTHGEHTIGRHSPLWLEDPQISRCHATIEVSARQMRLVATPGNHISRDDGTNCSTLDLDLGSKFRLGNTFFVVGDPVSSEPRAAIAADDLEVHVPAKPEIGRLVMLILAATVPILTGVLLAFLMGTIFFLIISGVSALMGLAPACQLVSELRRWKRAMRKQMRSALQARSNYAAPLGQSLIAGLDATALGITTLPVPPVVWGEGLWSAHLSDSIGSESPRKKWTLFKGRSLDAPWPSPVFAPPVPGIWHLVGNQDSNMGEVVANVLVRFIPLIASGKLSLIVDPTIHCLPASLLLLPNVSTSAPTPAAEASPWQQKETELRTIYLTSTPTNSLPETLIFSLCPSLPETAEQWIVLDSESALFPDQRFVLQKLHRLSLMRFDRTIQQFLDLVPSIDRPKQRALPQSAHRMSVSIGANNSGDEVSLDLDDDGPHMLICGTTGSGKSEALRRIVADLAYQFSPQQLALALVDFKGGAGLSVFESLPHVQLFASDLDESIAQRILEQLEYEVRRREEILANTGCSDLHEYQKCDAVPFPLPRLVIIVDEFRVFIDSLPTAAQRIDRLAAVGRALGIHLILSTQRPAGALTGQTRANINAVIALRVNDPSESVELVGSTDATVLNQPGLAIIKSASRPTEKVQFHLAVEPGLEGAVYERNRKNMALTKFSTFDSSTGIDRSDPLKDLAKSLASRWKSALQCSSSFAPPLPQSPEEITNPTIWPGIDDGSIYCGVRDNLSGGTLEPLTINTVQKRSLLICGLPEAGARKTLKFLASLPRKILCFGPSPVSDPEQYSNLKVVTGEDTYAFLDALDFLESLPRDRGLIVIVHSLAQLQSVLHPQHFQRFDEALGLLLRLGGTEIPFIVCAVDRDQNCLKSTGLFTTQWYFPLNATESLKMIWPKLPSCSALMGRGVVVNSDHPPQVFQLAPAQAKESGNRNWNSRSSTHSENDFAAEKESELLGYSPFTWRSVARPRQSRFIMICPDPKVRLSISRCLAERWNAVHRYGVEELLASLDDFDVAPEACPSLICIYLDSSADTRLAPALEGLRTLNIQAVVFTPASVRLAYELGLSAAGIDDREIAVVESEHSQDMQPMQWPALHRESEERHTPYWRAVISRYGQPRMILIPRGSLVEAD